MYLHPGIIRDVFVQAVYSLSDNKLRTVLSILGIAVGIAAVMAVGSVIQSAREYIFAEFQTYGLKTIWIYRDWGDDNENKVVRQGSGIDNDDFEVIQHGCCSAVQRASPVVYSQKYTVTVNNGNDFYDAPVEGVGLDYLNINNDNILVGRNFSRNDIEHRKEVALIGLKAAEELFGKNSSYLNKSFRLYKRKYTVIGVLANKKREIIAQLGIDNYDINGRVLIPYTVYQSILGSKDVHTLQAEAVSMDKTHEASKQLEDLLQRSHGGRYNYTTETMDGWINQAKTYLRNISLAGLFVASVSLLVGGMGIMNIMSTSVIERTREIGVRKAIGAQNHDILFQFLMEATYVSTIGGFIGLLLGIVAVYVVSMVSEYDLNPSWSMGFVAIVVSMLVGIVSGFYPAYRAAKLRPVDALRFE
ncbi:MAG: ABC transporter permease [Gammaproteobacteria bacterium]|nr:ABC transporter permease [Gammaproteobacteria bacterium]